jgi:hypothetical protein
MAAKSTSPTTKRQGRGPKSRGVTTKSASLAVVAFISTKRVVAQNLLNMAMVMTGSGTVLLGLLAAKHFQIASS